ncbi:BTAD domain-containing putative transcriptional regulator [Reyranella sp.]|uniref:BTAD domain-containing putative transcriptional regulator n=1 Tax=Reyranella sp. TaxID=1929291 RepID=UPI003D1110A8
MARYSATVARSCRMAPEAQGGSLQIRRAADDGAPSPRFGLALLGDFELTRPGGSVELASGKLAGLLAYLACTAPRPQSREKLSTLLWGSHFDAQARQNLRQALARLRRMLGQDAVHGDGETVWLNPAAVETDVVRFEALIRQGSREALSAAVDLYRGPLIADIAISEEGWNEWLTGERQRLLELALGALVRLAGQELVAGRGEPALKAARRAVALDGLREDAHRLVMQALAATGRKAEALKHYQDLAALLKRELATEPGRATRALAVELRVSQSTSGPSTAADIAEPVSVGHDTPAPTAHPERRQLTVMACGMVNTIALSALLDPEDMRDLIASFHNTVAEVVSRFDGFVAQYLGDGVRVYFGYPVAHEHDTEQAVRAGLALCEAIGGLRVGSGVALQARVGIATGLVVVGEQPGDGNGGHAMAVGKAPDLAARLQAVAAPGAVLIDAGTHRLVGRMFDCRALGADEARGLLQAAEAWEAGGETAGVSRFESRRSGVLSPFVGRVEEIELLLRRWQQAKSGEGRVVLLSGEPGIGKSRIAESLLAGLEGELSAQERYFCSPHHANSALYPFIGQLERAAGFEPGSRPETRLDRLEALLGPISRNPTRDISLLAELLGVPAELRYPTAAMSARQKREIIFTTLLDRLDGMAAQGPVLIVFEDAHWIDPTSLELLDRMVARVANLPALLIITFRPELVPTWIGQPHVTTLPLNRLGRRESARLIESIAREKALPGAVVEQVLARADGVPLFIEELMITTMESGLLRETSDGYALTGPLLPLAIPTTLQASLTTRLDRLGPARDVAVIGAAIGREFSHELIAAVSPLTAMELDAALERLVASGLAYRRGIPPDATYSFKHALVQDAAYATMLRRRRRQVHADIAKALIERFAALVESNPEIVARHLTEAGLVEQSVDYWSKAGRRSAGRSAMAEAAAQLQKALDQLALLPGTSERPRQELELLSSLGAALRFVNGLGSPETGRVFARARELWDQLGSPSEFLQVPYVQSLHHAACGELERARRLDEELLRLSAERKDPVGLVMGRLCSARTLTYCGEFALARSHLETALTVYDPTLHRSLVRQIGTHLHVGLQGFLGIVLFCLGYPDQALAHSEAAIAEAHELEHPPTLATGLTLGTRLLSLIGDDSLLDLRAGQLAALAIDQGFPVWRAEGTMYRGWVKVRNGDVAAGASLLRRGWAAYRATGSQMWMPRFFAYQAAACEIGGQTEEALTHLNDAMQIVERTGERWFVAELHRQKGRLLLRQGHSKAAEEQYRKALSIAQRQGAKLWELRATTSLARLRHDEGRCTEARDLLAPVYGWFTEGFATPDLKEAGELLDEIREAPTVAGPQE